MAFDLEELRQHVRSDKQRAAALAAAASEKLGQPAIKLLPDITGKPTDVVSFGLYKIGEQVALQGVQRDLFFARVDVTRNSSWAKNELVSMLVTKARVSPGTSGDGWETLSWTSPITKDILDKPIGETFEFQAKGCRPVQYTIGPSAKCEAVLPTIANATYLLNSGTAFVEREAELAEESAISAKKRPIKLYEARREFGLNEIIRLADVPQRAAMHLPFAESVLIDGPPGSGKTSIGIMRIPCLIDRQWDELGLDRTSAEPFHDVRTIRVLVLNDEMVGYLDSLVRSVGITGIPVQTMRGFLRNLCRDARTLSGRETREHGPSAHLKAHPAALDAYWAGFKRHVTAVLADPNPETLAPHTAIFGLGETVLPQLRKWAESLRTVTVGEGSLPANVNLAVRVDDFVRQAVASATKGITDPFRLDAVKELETGGLRDALRDLWPKLFDWIGVARATFATREYAELLKACEYDGLSRDEIREADEAWQKQCIEDEPQFTEYDAALAAWLGVHLALAPATGREPLVARAAERLTHVMIDEAQDVWPAHVHTIRKLVVEGGNLTLVGDLRQRLKDIRGLRRWSELGVTNLKTAIFAVNHRQSAELGRFVYALHSRLYGEPPTWEANEAREGPLPRILVANTRDMAANVANEIRHWRDCIPNATVGVLFDGHWSSDRRQRLHQRLEAELQDSLTEVHLVTPKSGAAALRKTDCVIIAPVVATKGLEFDAVVHVDSNKTWDDPLDVVTVRRKNGLYVAVSRACHGLSIVTRRLSSVFSQLEADGYCVLTEDDGAE